MCRHGPFEICTNEFSTEILLSHTPSLPPPYRSELAERESVLRTKVMRERDNLKMTLRHYRFALIRVRMPDGLIIQGK